MRAFEKINQGYNSVFKHHELSIGIVLPIENYGQSTVPSMKHHLERVQLVEKLGFKAIWLRDVPFHVPSFGDAGQTFDPFTYLGFLAGQTSEVALGISSIALPLHHPVHVAKSAATIDQLSNGRLIMGIASGDRPSEYPAMNIEFERRSEMFRDAYHYIRSLEDDFPILDKNLFGQLNGSLDVLPKPKEHQIPMLITGHSRQSMDWIAEHGNGWMSYPRNPMQQAYTIADWRRLIAQYHEFDKPFMQPLYVNLEKNDDFKPQPIQLGFRIGSKHLVDYLNQIKKNGVNHVAINLRFNSRPIEEVLTELAEKILPHFHLQTQKELI